jgi:hypothetical protein
MNNLNEKLFTNLKIISKIKVNEKIYINNDQFVIVEKNNLLLSIIRSIFKEDRHKNILQLNEIYDDIITYLNNKLHSKYLYTDNKNELEAETHIELCRNILVITDALEKSKNGINNLKQTYNHDTLVDSRLDNIINNIDNIINKTKEKIHIQNT